MEHYSVSGQRGNGNIPVQTFKYVHLCLSFKTFKNVETFLNDVMTKSNSLTPGCLNSTCHNLFFVSTVSAIIFSIFLLRYCKSLGGDTRVNHTLNS
jgi:hypothetical protein